MPVTLNLFRVRKFVPTPTKEGNVAFQIGDEHLGGGRPAQTKVAYRGKSEAGLETYVSTHEMLKRVQGRLYNGTEFSEYFKKNEVSLTLKRDSNLILCKSSGSVAKDLIDDLNEHYPHSFRCDYLAVDFDKIRPKITEMNGIWIGGINQPNIDTLALFGPDVDRSELYAALKSIGHAASMLIRQQVGSSSVLVIVSAKGSITFPQPAAEEEQIDRALQLYGGLLAGGLVERDSKQTAHDKREMERAAATAARRR